MNRINKLFTEKGKRILSIFTTAGHPTGECTMEVLEILEKNEVDLIEVGMPFSDPLADGPIIQNSSLVAIDNGMTLKRLFADLHELRAKVQVPIILMGYMNTVMQYGVSSFCKKCEEVGVDGVILPDLPLNEYQEMYETVFTKHGLINVFLITPQTSEERIRKLDHASKGFLYLVSSASTTGSNKEVNGVDDYLKRIQSMNLSSNTIVGFNIKDKASFETACRYSDGAIIGSAFVKAIAGSKDLNTDITNFIESITEKVRTNEN